MGASNLLTSPDGYNWTMVPGVANVEGVAFGKGVWVAVRGNGGNGFYSRDAVNWTESIGTVVLMVLGVLVMRV